MALTVERLKEVLHYDPASGVFMWLVDGRKALKGTVAGSPNDKGYIHIQIDGVLYKASRLAFLYMTGLWPTRFVDHKSTDKLDNRWGNLREATRQQNSHNVGLRKDSTSGVRGVSFKKRSGAWAAYITVPETKRRKWLGEFRSKDDAVTARTSAEIAMFGEFRRAA